MADIDFNKIVADLAAGKAPTNPKAQAVQSQNDYDAAHTQAQAATRAGVASVAELDRMFSDFGDKAVAGWGALRRGSSVIAPDLPDKLKADPVAHAVALGTGALGPLMGMATGKLAQAENAIENVGRRQRGEAPVDSDAVYRAYRDVADENRAKSTSEFPVTNFVGMLEGAKGAGKAVGSTAEFLGGLPGVSEAAAAVKNTAPVAKTLEVAGKLKAAAQDRLKTGLYDWLANTGKIGGTAAATSAAYSGLEGHTPQEHLQNAAHGGELGLLFGLGVGGIGAPALKFGGKALSDAWRAIGELASKDAPEGLITPENVEAAKQHFAEMAGRKGLTSSNVAEKAAPYSDPLAGQLLGVEGQNMTAALARRGGDTGDQMRELAFQRAEARPREAKNATAQFLGVHPDDARAYVEGVVSQGQQDVRPLYQALEDDPTGRTRPDLEALLNSHTGIRTLQHVNEMAKLEGHSPEGLALGQVEVAPPNPAITPDLPGGGPPPPPAEAAHPMDAPLVGERIIKPGEAAPALPPVEEVKVPRAPAEAPKTPGLSLHAWLSRQGGFDSNAMGEAMVRDIAAIGKRSKANAKIVGHLAEEAQDLGYFPNHEGATPVTADEFMDAVANSKHGTPLYPTHGSRLAGADTGAAARFEAARAAEEQNRTLHSQRINAQADSDEAFKAKQQADIQAQADWRHQMSRIGSEDEWRSLEPAGGAGIPEGYGDQVGSAPQYEPVPTTGLTPKSLVLLHQLSQPEYTNGVLNTDKANLRQKAFHDSLGRILTGHPETGAGALLPEYKAPLDAAKSYKATQGAFRDFSGSLITAKQEDFDTLMKSLKGRDGKVVPERMRGAQMAAVNDVYELWQAGQLKGGRFSAPGVELRLRALFGADASRALVDKMQRLSEQGAAETRMAPFSNSSSMAMLHAGQEQDQTAQAVQDLVQTLAKKGTGSFFGDLASRGAAYGRTAGMSMGYRNALGQLAQMKPAELEAFLREMESRPPPPPKPDRSGLIGRAIGAKVAW